MGMAEACAIGEEWNRIQVLGETFGHLYPKLGSEHPGVIEFAVGGFNAGEACSYDFEGLASSPVLFEDVGAFLFKQLFNGGPWARLQPGFYIWEGVYKKFKNATCLFCKGDVRLIHAFKGYAQSKSSTRRS